MLAPGYSKSGSRAHVTNADPQWSSESGSAFLTRSRGEKHCLSSCYNFIFKIVFLGILGFMDEQQLGWEPPHHEVDTLAPNPPAAPIVYRIKFKLLRLEFKTFSTWLQWTESSQHELPFPAPFRWSEMPFTLPSSSPSFPGLAENLPTHSSTLRGFLGSVKARGGNEQSTKTC